MSDNTEQRIQSAIQQTDAEVRFQCRHIRASGKRCGIAALRDQNFCYYHHSTHTPVPKKHVPRYPDENRQPFAVPVIEDRASIRLAISQVLARIASNDVDLKRASLLLYGLQIASCALPRTSAKDDAESESIEPQELLGDLILDDSLGPLAPISEVVPPPLSRFELLRLRLSIPPNGPQRCQRCCSEIDPPRAQDQQDSTQQPAIIPNLNAVAAIRIRKGKLLAAPTSTFRPCRQRPSPSTNASPEPAPPAQRPKLQSHRTSSRCSTPSRPPTTAPTICSPSASTAAGGTAPPAPSAPSSSAPKPSSSTSAAAPAT